MNTLTDKQLEILIGLLDWGKSIEIPSLHRNLTKKGKKVHINEIRKTVPKLEKMKLIKVEKIPVASRVFYRLYPKTNYETFKKLGSLLLQTTHRFEFIKSNYAQSMINEKFLDHFAIHWCREFYRLLQRQGSKMYGKDVDEIEDDKLRNGFYAYFGDGWTDAKGFTKEKLLKILQKSPLSLFNFLFPEEVLKEGLRVSSITDYFLYPFISDMMYMLPRGNGMEIKLQLSFGNLKKEITNLKDLFELVGKRDFTPTIKVKTESRIYNLSLQPSFKKKDEKSMKRR